MRLRNVLSAVLMMSLAVFAHAATISEFTSGSGALNLSTVDGQAFLVLGSGDYTNIAFNFYDPSQNPYAIGTAYLFSSPYAGTPADLTSAAGILGSATAHNGFYDFGSSVTLTTGNTYYLFEDTVIPAGSILGASPTSPQFFEAPDVNSVFGAVGATANYTVTGDSVLVGATPTPEPTSFVLLSSGLVGSLTFLRKRLRSR